MTTGEILELLELSPEAPSLAFLRRLFDAFNARIPFESASKIERAARIRAPEDGPVTTDAFWTAHRERGAGGICFARTFAFGELCRELGFSAGYLLGAIGAPRSHAALLLEISGQTLVADVGFPLPAIYSLEDGEFETARGAMRVTGKGWRVDFPGSPMADTAIRFEPGGASDAELRQAWIASFAVPTHFSRQVELVRRIDSRVLRFARGEVAVLDAHSKMRIPLPGSRAAKLSNLFDIDSALVAGALARTGDPDPEIAEPELLSYLDVPDARGLLSFVATPEGYRQWVSGLGDARVAGAREGTFSVAIRPSAGETVEDHVSISSDGSLEIVRSGGLARTSLSMLDTPAGPHLVRRAVLPGRGEELLSSDLARGRIAGLLAMDLVALARLSENEPLVVAQKPKPRIP